MILAKKNNICKVRISLVGNFATISQCQIHMHDWHLGHQTRTPNVDLRASRVMSSACLSCPTIANLI